MYVSLNLFLCAGSWYATKWIPGLPSLKEGTFKMLTVGLDVAGLNILSWMTLQLDRIVVGRISNASTLGIYERGGQVPSLISHQLRLAAFSFVLPALSSLQNIKESFRTYYYNFLYLLSWPTMVLGVFCFLFADEIIYFYFGSQWLNSAFFMKIFAVKAVIVPAITSLDQVPLTLGYSRQYLWAGSLRSITTCGIVGLTAFFYGIEGAAVGASVSDLFIFLPFFIICTKNSGICIQKFLKTITPPLFTSLIAGLVIYVFKTPFSKDTISYSFAFMLGYFAIILPLFGISDYINKGEHISIIKWSAQKLGKAISF